MTHYLLDTNVISETARPRPNERVVEWIRSLTSLSLPAIAVYELAAGIRRLPPGKRRTFLDGWFADLLEPGCEVLALDRDGALASADIEMAAREKRRAVEHRDLLILGIARSRSFGIATRNVSHFRGLNVPIYNPFDDVYDL